ncbi:hypothetical protein [Lactococcus garvieae]|uniref:hypothetical protein n=1 Tax=Lactococcus garvieae TaxID=1363 RepID=UPI0034625F22
MALYNNWVITKKYASTEVAAISTQNKIEFVRFISSDDKFAQSDLESFDDLVLSTIKIKSAFPVSSVKISGSTVTVTGILNSTGNTVDYDMNTLLLVCKYNGAEFLAAATTAQTPFRLPAENAAEVTEYTIRPQLTLSNSDTVSTVVDPVSPATNERVDDEVKKLQDQIDSANTDRKSIWDKIADLVDKSTNQTIAGIKTFTSTIVGNISGNAGSATKLKTPQKVTLTGDASGSTTFDGTQAVGLTTTLATITQSDTTSSVSPNYNETFTTVDSVKTDTKGRVTGANTKTVKLPVAYVHPSVSQNDTTSSESPNNGSTFEVVDSVQRNSQGHVTGVNTKTVTMPTQANVTGNAGTATKLKTARKINGADFDGTQDINVNAANDSDIVHKSGTETIMGRKNFGGIVQVNAQPRLNGTTEQALLVNTSGTSLPLLRFNENLTGQGANGNTVGISLGANTIIGGGESPASILAAMEKGELPPVLSGLSGGNEHGILSADQNVYIGAGYQSGGVTGKWWKFGNDGKLISPAGDEILDTTNGDKRYASLTEPNHIQGETIFDQLHFSSDTEKIPLEFDAAWTANGHYVKMTNGILSIYIDGARPKVDGLTGQSYYTVARLPAGFRDIVSAHDIQFVWSSMNGGVLRYSGKVQKSTGDIIFYLAPNTDKLMSTHRFSIYIPYVPV